MTTYVANVTFNIEAGSKVEANRKLVAFLNFSVADGDLADEFDTSNYDIRSLEEEE